MLYMRASLLCCRVCQRWVARTLKLVGCFFSLEEFILPVFIFVLSDLLQKSPFSTCFLPFSLYRKSHKLNATLCRDSVERRVAIVLSELWACSVSAPATQIRGCSTVWIIHFQCACHQTRSTYCQPTITQTTLSAIPPAWHCSDNIVFPPLPNTA